MQETQVPSLGLEDPLGKGIVTHSSCSCLENSMDRGGRLVGYSPRGPKESDMTEKTSGRYQAAIGTPWLFQSVTPLLFSE